MSDRQEQKVDATVPVAVSKAYEQFDRLRDRGQPLFDAGDVQNLHLWMAAVTRALAPVPAPQATYRKEPDE